MLISMKIYKPLNGEEFDLDALPSNHQEIWRDVEKEFNKSPGWNDFSNFWRGRMTSLVRNGNRSQVAAAPIFKICQDLESRLGIEQGYIKKGDYRDSLEMLIDREFPSRYAFCKKAEIDEAFLSHVLKKKRNLSIAKLQEVMENAGYSVRIIFEKKLGDEQKDDLKMTIQRKRRADTRTRKLPRKKQLKMR
jgi:hypothetical protein